MSAHYAKRIAIPSQESINTGLKSPKNASVLDVLGKPDRNKAQALLTTVDVGPFTVYGNRLFLAALKRAFGRASALNPDLVSACKNVGAYNLRPVRGSKTVISDHGWGLAIDLYFGREVTPRGSNQTEQGLFELYPYFHAEKLYWGAEFPTDDGMHFGTSLELLLSWQQQGLI
jgi:hypothetical protein